MADQSLPGSSPMPDLQGLPDLNQSGHVVPRLVDGAHGDLEGTNHGKNR